MLLPNIRCRFAALYRTVQVSHKRMQRGSCPLSIMKTGWQVNSNWTDGITVFHIHQCKLSIQLPNFAMNCYSTSVFSDTPSLKRNKYCVRIKTDYSNKILHLSAVSIICAPCCDSVTARSGRCNGTYLFMPYLVSTLHHKLLFMHSSAQS